MGGSITIEGMKKSVAAVALALLAACPALAKDAPRPAAADAAPGGASALKIQPAEATTAATRAPMLAAAKAGKRIVAAGDHGIVLLSDDDGASFRQAKSVPVRSTLTSLFFVDDKTGWAAGHWGVVLRTDDGGETWQIQRSDTSVDQPIFSVYFKDRDRGWAVGLWSLMLSTRDGGRTWTALRLPLPPGAKKADRNLQKIFANSLGTLFVAAEQGTVLRSYDGENFSYLATGYKGTFWTGIALSNGTILVGGLRGTIYRSADGGRSWRESRTELKSSVTDFVESAGKIYAAALDGVIFESTDGGASFKGTQRDDRLPFTAVSLSSTGRLVMFSKLGVVADSPKGQAK